MMDDSDQLRVWMVEAVHVCLFVCVCVSENRPSCC